MKSTNMFGGFRDQVDTIINLFQSWNDCEQTIALFSLLRELTPVQKRFLSHCLEQGLQDNKEIKTRENQANDPAYIAGLCNESKESAVLNLLECLPLLRPGHVQAKNEYLQILHKILFDSIENGCHIEECRQLLSYWHIHPAIPTHVERSQFDSWLGLLERYPSSNGRSEAFPPFSVAPGGNNNKNGAAPTPVTSVYGGLLPHGAPGMESKRDSGIIGDMPPPENGSPAVSVLSGVPGGPRAITSTSAVCPPPPEVSHHNGHVPLHMTHSGPSAFHTVPNQGVPGQVSNGHRKLVRSSSVTPPMSVPSKVPEWLNRHHDEMTRSSTRTSEPHAPLSPQSSITSSGSGSESHQDDGHQRNSFLEEGTGMRDVPIWLKSLRLHKYACLFQRMKYDEMMNLTEEWLEAQNVTKGARNKIILSIKKLKERPSILRQMEKEIMESGNLKQALTELKSMLNTPIKGSAQCAPEEATSGEENKENEGAAPTDTEVPEGDIPGQMIKVIGKVCTKLSVDPRTEDDCFCMYLQLLDKCLMHEAFSVEQKKKLSLWKQQVQKVWHPPPQKYNFGKPNRGFGGSNTFPMNNILRSQQRALSRGGPQLPAKWTFNGSTGRPNVTVGGPTVPGTGMPLYRNNSFNTAFNTRPVMDVGRPLVKPPVTRTHSAPIKSSFGLSLSQRPIADMNATEPEINARLDSLCLSMTEHALGSLGESLW